MKIKITPFKKEIEITPNEIVELYSMVHPNSGVWEWFCEALGIKRIINKQPKI
jgi:hypothetical protein